MKTILLACLVMLSVSSFAQVEKVSLQASGLTCSMCSKAVKKALDEISFVEKVQVDIRNQQYNISFKENSTIDLDALRLAVEDAGFSVAALQVTAKVTSQTLSRDQHVRIGSQYFHFLNASGQEISEKAVFSVVDKNFVSDKEFSKYSALTKMKCVESGRSEGCCSSGEMPANTRIFHVIL